MKQVGRWGYLHDFGFFYGEEDIFLKFGCVSFFTI